MPKKGYKPSEETRKKMSQAHKGKKNPFAGFKKGHPPYAHWIGRKHSELSKEKMRKSRNLFFSNHPEEKQKISLRQKGKPSWNDGLTKYNSDGVRRIAESKIGKPRTFETKMKSSAKKQCIPLEKWEKFISREPYSQNWNNRFKRAIRKRDNDICMFCGIHSEKLNRSLCIHHINYDKKLTIPQNCVSLCNDCHLKTQTKREMWKKIFQEILSKQYNYQYENENVKINYINPY